MRIYCVSGVTLDQQTAEQQSIEYHTCRKRVDRVLPVAGGLSGNGYGKRKAYLSHKTTLPIAVQVQGIVAKGPY